MPTPDICIATRTLTSTSIVVDMRGTNPSGSARALSEAVKGTALLSGNLFNVSGWVAVVTGGGTGLGLVTALTLAENGCKVYITGRRSEVLDAAARSFAANGKNSGSIVAVTADVSNKAGIAYHGVSEPCANINDCEQTSEGLSEHMFNGESFDTWMNTYRINTASYFFTSFALLPLLWAAETVAGFSEPGNIINLSSISGITVTSQRGQFNYNASKAATLSLSKMLAAEFAKRNLGIRVNCICPGYFPSGMTVIDAADNTGSVEHSADFRNSWGIPLARLGNTVDYAQCVLSVATNQYITGAEIVIDGGWLLQSGEYPWSYPC